MNQNILYKNLDMLSVMESCEDNSKDFILLFMPSNMGGTVGDAACQPIYSIEEIRELKIASQFGFSDEDENLEVIQNSFALDKERDFGEIDFYKEKDYQSYIELIKKIAQNAKRILTNQGTFCFGISDAVYYIDSDGTKTQPEIPLIIQQLFPDIRTIEIPNYHITYEDGNPDRKYAYTLYICGEQVKNWADEDYGGYYYLKRPSNELVDSFEKKYVSVLEEMWFPKMATDEWVAATADHFRTLLLELFISELRTPDVISKMTTMNVSAFSMQQKTDEQIQMLERVKDRELEDIRNLITNEKASIPLAACLMETFCDESSRMLFPYDRNGQYAFLASKYGNYWESLYKLSLTKEEIGIKNARPGVVDEIGDIAEQFAGAIFCRTHTNYLQKISDGGYTIRMDLPEHEPITYDSEFLTSAKEANELKAKYSKISGILNDIIECAAENGMENSEDMEQAVHYVMQMAVKGETKVDAEKLVREWYGKGFDELSDKCQTFLRTAIAFEKMAESSGTMDKAPVMLEYSRALEQELNSSLIKAFIAYVRENTDEVWKIIWDTKKDDSVAKYLNLLKAILSENLIRGMTLGEISQCIKMAARASDGDIYGIFTEFCKQNGHENLLESNNVGRFGMAAKLRNLCAHPSDIDDGCMNQNRQLVLEGLKAQQGREKIVAINRESSICAIIGPDNSKMKYPEDSTNMKAAIKKQILMLYQSGVRQFASTGNSGFDLMVAEILDNCRKTGEAKSIKLTEYLPCERDKMKFTSNRKRRVTAVDKHATIEICGDADNATNKGICQTRALENAAFCIAFYAEDGKSAISRKITEAIENGTIVYNAYGID